MRPGDADTVRTEIEKNGWYGKVRDGLYRGRFVGLMRLKIDAFLGLFVLVHLLFIVFLYLYYCRIEEFTPQTGHDMEGDR